MTPSIYIYIYLKIRKRKLKEHTLKILGNGSPFSGHPAKPVGRYSIAENKYLHLETS